MALWVDGEPFTESEVLAGAVLAGAADDALQALDDGLASVALAEELGDEVSEEDLQAAFEAWRLDRDLVAAEEFEAWLKAEELELDDVAAHLERKFLAERLAAALEGRPEYPRPEFEELLSLLPVTVAIDGAWPRLGEELALRAVAPPPDQAALDALDAERQRVLRRLGCASWESLRALLAPLDVADNRLRAILDREVAFSLLRADLGRDDVLAQLVRDERDDLMAYELADASFGDVDVAREVVCCVREDRDPLPRAAGRAGQDCRRQLLAAEEVGASPYRHRLVSARARDVFGPYVEGERFVVVQVLRRVEPDLRSDRVRAVALDRIVRRVLGREVLDRVRYTGREAA